jgi:hypothetical protein
MKNNGRRKNREKKKTRTQNMGTHCHKKGNNNEYNENSRRGPQSIHSEEVEEEEEEKVVKVVAFESLDSHPSFLLRTMQRN